MATQLNQVISFTAVAAGGQQTVAHNMNWNGRTVIPDLVYPSEDNPAFTVISVTATDMTIRNDSGLAADFQFWLMSLHSIFRAFGHLPVSAADEFLSPLPFIVGGGAGGGSGGGNVQSFRYTVTGVEPDLSDFMVTLPSPRLNDTYRITGNCAGVTVIVAFDFPDLIAGDRTTTEFRVIASAPMQAGDQIDFHVIDVVM